MRHKIILALVLTLMFTGVAIAGAVIYYGYTTTTPGCDYRIRNILKDGDIVDETPGYDVTYHIDSSTANIPLIRDIQQNAAGCVFYYDVLPECNNTPLYCLSTEGGFLLTPKLVYTGSNQSIIDMYGVGQ